jgi:hypothetical protein
MSVSNYGVNNAPGVALELQTADKTPQPGALGTTVIFGAFERGPVGAPRVPPVRTNTKGMLIRRRGGFVEEQYARDAAGHFLDAARGAGALHTIRVTDGTEVKAAQVLRGRKPPMGVLFCQPDAAFNIDALTITAKNGGGADGRRKVYGGLLSGAGQVVDNTVDTEKVMLKDEYKGATFRLMGVTSKSYTVVSNTAAGVFTFDSDLDLAADLAAGDPANLYWNVSLANLRADGTRKAIGVQVKPRGQRRPTADFGLLVYLDRAKVWDVADLAMVSATGRSEVETTLTQKADNYELDVDNEWAGSDDPLARPANWAGIAAAGGLGTTTLRLHIVEWRITSGDANGYLSGFLYGSDVREDELTLDFTGATAYDISSTLVDDLPSAVVLGAKTYHQTHPFLTGFTITAGTTPFEAGDQVKIRIKPLPTDGSLKGALLYPDGAGVNAARAIPVLSNTYDTITVPSSYDLTDYASEPAEATVETLSAGPWDCDPALTLTGIELEDGVVAPFTTATDASYTAAELKVAWEAHDARLLATIQDDGTVLLGGRSTGAGALFKYTGGTMCGVIVPAATQTKHGTDGSLILLEHVQELGGGYDGIADLAAAHLVSAMDPSGSIAELFEGNVGMPLLAAPGWDDDDVVAAGQALAEAVLGMYVPDFADSVTTEDAAVAKVAGTWGESDFYAPVWPSWAYMDRPETGEIDLMLPVVGKVLGLMAYSFSTFGMGKAPAGDYLELTGINRWVKAEHEVPPDAELLNKAGIRALTPYGTARPLLWGDRMPGRTRTWLHKACLGYQLARELLWKGSPIRAFIFRINDALTWGPLRVAVRSLLERHYWDGWFRRDLPRGFEDAVSIRLDSETTPPEVAAAGQAVLVIGYVAPDTIEQVYIKLGESTLEIG